MGKNLSEEPSLPSGDLARLLHFFSGRSLTKGWTVGGAELDAQSWSSISCSTCSIHWLSWALIIHVEEAASPLNVDRRRISKSFTGIWPFQKDWAYIPDRFCICRWFLIFQTSKYTDFHGVRTYRVFDPHLFSIFQHMFPPPKKWSPKVQSSPTNEFGTSAILTMSRRISKN